MSLCCSGTWSLDVEEERLARAPCDPLSHSWNTMKHISNPFCRTGTLKSLNFKKTPTSNCDNDKALHVVHVPQALVRSENTAPSTNLQHIQYIELFQHGKPPYMLQSSMLIRHHSSGLCRSNVKYHLDRFGYGSNPWQIQIKIYQRMLVPPWLLRDMAQTKIPVCRYLKLLLLL